MIFKRNKNKNEKRQGFVKRSVKSMVNVKRWVAWDEIKSSGKGLVGLGKDLFVPKKAEHKETFEQAKERLQLSEKDIADRRKAFLRLAIIYLCIALVLFVYALYIFLSGVFFAGFLSLTLSVLVLVYAFKEHFWYTQIRHRRFGLTFKEWFNLTFKTK